MLWKAVTDLYAKQIRSTIVFMCSFQLAMCSFHSITWLFYSVMRSFHLVMCSFHSVIWLFYSVMCSFHLVMCSFHSLCALSIIRSLYLLFLCALFMRSFYVLFLCALCMCSFHALFLACQDCRSFIIANAFQWYGQPTVAVNCPKYNQVPLDKFMVSVNMPEVICSFYVIYPSFKPTFPSRLNTSFVDTMHAISKSVTLNDYSPPFQKFPQDSFATKWKIVC